MFLQKPGELAVDDIPVKSVNKTICDDLKCKDEIKRSASRSQAEDTPLILGAGCWCCRITGISQVVHGPKIC